jgi:hypothetical protein
MIQVMARGRATLSRTTWSMVRMSAMGRVGATACTSRRISSARFGGPLTARVTRL